MSTPDQARAVAHLSDEIIKQSREIRQLQGEKAVLVDLLRDCHEAIKCSNDIEDAATLMHRVSGAILSESGSKKKPPGTLLDALVEAISSRGELDQPCSTLELIGALEYLKLDFHAFVIGGKSTLFMKREAK